MATPTPTIPLSIATNNGNRNGGGGTGSGSGTPSPQLTPRRTQLGVVTTGAAAGAATTLRYDRMSGSSRVSAISPSHAHSHRERTSSRSIDGLPNIGVNETGNDTAAAADDDKSADNQLLTNAGSGARDIPNENDIIAASTRSRGSSHSHHRQSSVLTAASLGSNNFSRHRPARPSFMLPATTSTTSTAVTSPGLTSIPSTAPTRLSSRHVIMTDGASPALSSSSSSAAAAATTSPFPQTVNTLNVGVSPGVSTPSPSSTSLPMSPSSSSDNLTISPLLAAAAAATPSIVPAMTTSTGGSGSGGSPGNNVGSATEVSSPSVSTRSGPKRSRDPSKRHSVVMMEFSPDAFRFDKRPSSNSLGSPSNSTPSTPSSSVASTTSITMATVGDNDIGTGARVSRKLASSDKTGDSAIPTLAHNSSAIGITANDAQVSTTSVTVMPGTTSATTTAIGVLSASTLTSSSGISIPTIDDTLRKKRSRLARERWKNAMAKVVATNKLAHMKLQKVDEEGVPANALPERIADYFLVFSCPRQPLDGITTQLRRQSERPLSELNRMVDTGNNVLQHAEPVLFDRYPRHDHTKFPVDKAWGAWAFPDGLTLSVKKRPASCYHAVMTLAEGTQLFATYLRFDEPLVGSNMNYSPPVSPSSSPSHSEHTNATLLAPGERTVRGDSGTGDTLFDHAPSEPPSPTFSFRSPPTPAATSGPSAAPLLSSSTTGRLSTGARDAAPSMALPTATISTSSTVAGPSTMPVIASMASLLPSSSSHGSLSLSHDGPKAPPPLPATPPQPRVGPAKMTRKGTAPALLTTPIRTIPVAPGTAASSTLAQLPSTPLGLTHSSSAASTPSVVPPPKPSFFDRMRKQLGGKHSGAPSTPATTSSSSSSSIGVSMSHISFTSPSGSVSTSSSHMAPPAHPHPSHLLSPSATANPPSPRHTASRSMSTFASPAHNQTPYMPSTPASTRPISMSMAPPTPASSAPPYGTHVHGTMSVPSTPSMNSANTGSGVHARTYSLPFTGATSPLALVELQAKIQASQLYIPRTICLVSHYPVFDVMRKSLCEWYGMSCDNNGKSRAGVTIESEIMLLISELPVPIPGLASVHWIINDNVPLKCSFPSLRHPLTSTFSLWNLFNSLSVDHVLTILGGMLCEERILFHSSSLSQLTVITQSLLQLLYPFQWWYAYIPVLAKVQLDAYQIPQPYILGVQSKYLGDLTELPDDVIIVDIDHNSVRCGQPLTPLPARLGRTLWERLRMAVERRCASADGVNQNEEKISEKFDAEVYKAILRFYAEIFSGFRKFLFFIQDVPFFNGGSFLQAKCGKDPASKPFFTKILGSRAFDVFIEEELNPDGFHEVLHGGPGASTSRRLQIILEQERKTLFPFVVPSLAPVTTFHREHNGSLSIVPASSPSSTTSISSPFPFGQSSPSSGLSSSGSISSSMTPASTSVAAMNLPSAPVLTTSPSGGVAGILAGPFTSPLSAYYWAQPRRISIDGDTSSTTITLTGVPNGNGNISSGASGSISPDDLSLQTPSSSTRRVSSQSGRLMVDKSRTRAKHLETKNNRAPEELMKGYLSRIFGSSSQREAFTSTDHSHIRSLLIDGKVRTSVSTILRQPQSGGTASLCLGSHAYRDMAFVLTVLLDYCMSQKDYVNAISVLESGNIFFNEDSVSGSRTFIERETTPHIFWRDLSFWRYVLESSIHERIKDAKQAPLHGRALTDFVLSCMLRMVSQMHSHNLPANEVWHAVDDMCRKHSLDATQQEEVKRFWTNLENLRVAMQEAEDYARI